MSDLLGKVRPGSADWTWPEEFADLDSREPEYLERLKADIERRGIRSPVEVGDDGRLWNGHHRVRIAVLLDLEEIPVVVFDEE